MQRHLSNFSSGGESVGSVHDGWLGLTAFYHRLRTDFFRQKHEINPKGIQQTTPVKPPPECQDLMCHPRSPNVIDSSPELHLKPQTIPILCFNLVSADAALH